MLKETLDICKKCRENQIKLYPNSANCAFLHNNEYCSRLEDINLLIEKLLKKKDIVQ
jgi:hypothetical protein